LCNFHKKSIRFHSFRVKLVSENNLRFIFFCFFLKIICL
jgi:hypothetical protein